MDKILMYHKKKLFGVWLHIPDIELIVITL